MTYLKQLKTLGDKVVDILERYPESRSSDPKLMTILYRDHFNLDTQFCNVESFFKKIEAGELPCTESIRRSRQKIQQSGKYPAVKSVFNKRKELECDVHGQVIMWG